MTDHRVGVTIKCDSGGNDIQRHHHSRFRHSNIVPRRVNLSMGTNIFPFLDINDCEYAATINRNGKSAISTRVGGTILGIVLYGD